MCSFDSDMGVVSTMKCSLTLKLMMLRCNIMAHNLILLVAINWQLIGFYSRIFQKNV